MGCHPEGPREAGEVGLCEPHEVLHVDRGNPGANTGRGMKGWRAALLRGT